MRRNLIAEEQSLDASSSSGSQSRLDLTESSPRCKKLKNTKKIEYLKEQCVNLVTIHGRPFSLINDEAFRNILALTSIDPAELTVLHSRSVRELLIKKADDIRRDVSMKLQDKLISIKIDGATRTDRAFLGVNTQYVENGKIHIIHLGVVELHTRSTSENLKEKLLYVLRKYRISIKQILTITTDNGANYVKVSKLINEELEGASREETEEDSSDEDQENSTDLFENISLQDDAIVNDGGGVTYSVTSVRCVAHTLQLAIGDALSEDEGIIEVARAVVRQLRTPSVRQILKAANKKKAILDCPTRWHSTLDMLQRLTELRECCSANPRDPLFISNNTWDAIDDIIQSLRPAKYLTKVLQFEQLTIGDFYYQWTKCILETEKVMVPLAQYVAQAMKSRQKNLMDSPHFVGALYLDPRFQVVLSDQEISTAISYLQSIWCQILRLKSEMQIPQGEQAQNLFLTDSNDILEDEVEKLLVATEKSKQQTNQVTDGRRSQPSNIIMRLEEFNNYPRINSKENILKFWETRKHSDPLLFKLACNVLAIPCTQVSVERLFSSLKFVLADLRYNLKDSIVEDILVIRNNTCN